ncbi:MULTISPECIES: biliverdin-producing heme oxygenase [unclassified Pusillimonas]|uniref:biliverdin-producing heme oxygenase n=1 Tax=unclassified Pusillimonas TaxID=2640016 RepID=UPI000B9CC4FF|nr:MULTISPECIES: biliverdin-producing heme oxygenase [unclassified Pusillimonas]OXR50044.1 hypothetical protein PuT2_04560 [Pusillimonas sp. T2]ROT46573.1 hypothetical protein CHR62_01165 [Pusillimonas sp. NJUB218]
MNAAHEARHAGRQAWLRNHTQALHARLDSSAPLRALLQPGLTSVAYQRVMAAMYTAHAQVEPELLALDSARPPALPAYASRLTLISLEIARHNNDGTTVTPAHVGTALAPTHTFVSPADKRHALEAIISSQQQSRYLGLRYVLEGATQGSRFIQRSLQQHNPGLRVGPDSYWATLANNSNAWSCLCDIINDQSTDIDDAELLAGATLGFKIFINTFYSTAT